MSYMVFEKDGSGTPTITDKKKAQEFINKGYKVRIDKANWGLKKQKSTAKSTAKKTTKK